MKDVLTRKIADALAAQPPPLTRRDVRHPAVRGKTPAVFGMRGSGKTTFLWRCIQDRLNAGASRESLLCLSFEGERLVGLEASHLTWVVEEYYRFHPGRRNGRTAAFFFDEIQTIPGRETFARRLLDAENVELFLSGSSVRLLSCLPRSAGVRPLPGCSTQLKTEHSHGQDDVMKVGTAFKDA